MDRAALNRSCEAWGYPAVYDPVVQFKEPAREGAYVNVDAAGFRRGLRQAIWPPQDDRPSVFFFGGSTTFGYNVRDEKHWHRIFRTSRKPHSAERSRCTISAAVTRLQRKCCCSCASCSKGTGRSWLSCDGLNDFQHGGSRDLLNRTTCVGCTTTMTVTI